MTTGTSAGSSPFSRMFIAQACASSVVLRGGAAAAVGDEGHRVRVLQHDAPRGVVDHLPRHGEELHLHLEARGGGEEDGQQVEEQRAVVVRLHGQQAAAHLGARARVQLRRLVVFPLSPGP